jgi:cytochrome c peroxidase
MKKRPDQVLVINISWLAVLCLLALGWLANACLSKSGEPNRTSLFELGRYLFYDLRLSSDGTRACATCHNPAFSFTDGYKRSVALGGVLHQRNSQPLVNLKWMRYLTAADSTLHHPIQQINRPLYNLHPSEMGVALREQQILQTLRSDAHYRACFTENFGSDTASLNWLNIKKAIVAFVDSINTYNSPYDRWMRGDTNALSTDEKKGMQLFYSTKLGCQLCHGGVNFATPQPTVGYYHNIGLYNLDGHGAYPLYDQGLIALTNQAADMGKYRIPTLRQLAFTAPYFHDGSVATLTQALEIFWQGGSLNAPATGLGNGIVNQFKNQHIQKIDITAGEKMQVLKFLLALSDSSLLNAPRYSNPFTVADTKK